METFVWLRVPGDILFAAGSVLLAVYALRLLWPAGRTVKLAPAAVPATAKR
jgi:nitric oxide reductase subunit B